MPAFSRGTGARPGAHSGAVTVESRALLAAAIALLVGALVGVIVFNGQPAALFGTGSVGLVAAITGVGVALAAFVVSYTLSFRNPANAWRRTVALPRLVLDIVALAFTHAAIVLLLTLVVFSQLQGAFLGLTLDAWTASLSTGIVVAAFGYFVYLSASGITTYTLSTLLAVFLISGALTSMLTANDANWWQYNFSSLGAGDGLSPTAFNLTMVISGVVITTLADYLATDLDGWARRHPHYKRWRIAALRWALVAIGVCLIGVALVPVSLSEITHNIFATGMVVIFFALVLGIRFLIPGFHAAFFAVTTAVLVALTIATVLFFPVGYYNLTGFELISGALVFVWLILFTRNVGAALADNGDQASAPV
ncbi:MULTISPECIES: DUF998 domain-containing protein [unclassified Salinibacterium]|uniref:DUF998 domain-containing protein n=1 Tax=unclassified Salinibacterium TaxID=2632331 RepID=UPI0014233ABE|nr:MULTISPECIES: DUF998 domain-containing protein [unclassified Salinibacterium]